MRRLYRLGAVVIGAGAALAVLAQGPIRLERTLAGAPVSSGRANRALAEPTDGSTDGGDDIQVELLVPPVLLVPESSLSSSTPVKLILKVTNNMPNPVRFPRFDPLVMLILETRETSGRVLRHGAGRGMFLNTERIDCPVAMPSQTVTFSVEGELFWKDNQLVLEGQDGLGGWWNIYGLRPGTYQMRAKYMGRRATALCDDPETGVAYLTEGMWTGKATSPFVEFQVGEP